MIDSFKRFRLQQKGLSCGRKRREREVSRLQEFLRCSPVVTALLLAGSGLFFGWLVLARPVLGVPLVDEPTRAVLVMMLIFLGAILQFSVAEPGIFHRNSRLLLVLGLLALHLGLMKLTLNFVEDNFFPGDYKMLLLPFGLAPMALTVLLGRGPGLFATILISLWGSLMVEDRQMLAFLVTSLGTGMVAVAASHEVHRRKHFLRAGFLVGGAAFGMALLFGHLQAFHTFGDSTANWRLTAYEGLLVLAVNLTIGIIVSSFLPLVESIFRITTAAAWVELSDLNHPLLRRLTIEAPGTYHHSLVVANLAEAAAEVIGANPLMTRVCSYFHDIGKLNNPDYFVENQPPDANPHDSMTPSMSALVVLSHVKDGVDLALRHKLSRDVIDTIEQHHGTSLVWFFYQRALEKRKQIRALADQDKAHQTDVPEVDEKSFRYPGPKPQLKEIAIISLADALESASRALEKPTPQKIEQLVEEIVRSRVLDGQLDECNLTLAELDAVRKSFVASLRSMLHKRVAYERTAEGTARTATTDLPARMAGATTRFEVVRKAEGKTPDPAEGRAA
ncbi:MAG: HD family phosphohydrolase [Verrucomicrobiales bacterium]